jgi:hypothetical protein
MTNYTGTILELNGNKAIVMTDACDFISIQKQSEMFVGQQVKLQKSDLYTLKKNYIKHFALVASVFIIAFSYVLYYQFFMPSAAFAYIDVDINPSLEFAIDKNAQVLDIKPLNKDAQTLLKNLKLVDLPIKQAIAEVVKESKQQGFIKPNKKNAVLISASIDADKNYKTNVSEEKVLDNILTGIDSTTFDLGNEKIKPEVLKVIPEYRSLAVKNEISMGRYALYNKIKQKDINITIEEAKTARVSDMLDKAQINGSNDIKFKTKNGDDTQINITEENKNYDSTSDNNKDETTKSGNDNTFEKKKNVDRGKNEGTKDNNTNNSGTGTSDKTDQSTTVDPTNKANDTSNTDTSDKTDQSTTVDSTNKADDTSNTGTSDNTDQSTTVDSTN